MEITFPAELFKEKGKNTLIINRPHDEIFCKVRLTPKCYAVDGWIGEQHIKENLSSEWELLEFFSRF